jgi:hypothetical protein
MNICEHCGQDHRLTAKEDQTVRVRKTYEDPALAEKMRLLALESYSNYADPAAFYLVRFDRVKESTQ